MSEHLIVLSEGSGPQTAGAWATLAGDLSAGGWSLAHAQAGAQVWSLGAWPVRVRPTPDGEGLLVGDVFPLERAGADRAGALLDQVWGAFVAVWPARAGHPVQVMRDPSGAREALIWRSSGLMLIASRLSAPALRRWWPQVRVDGDQVARFLVDPSEIAGPLALDGVEAVTAGALWSDGRRETPVWTPARSAAAGLTLSREEAAAELRARLDGVLRSWAGLGRPLIAEISGGLDSAIVACALAPAAPVRRWITFYGATPDSDERVYARQVAERLGVRLDEREKPAPRWDAAALAEISGAPRPAVSALDVHYDRAMAAEATSAGAWAVVTGQGGDSVFLNLRSPLIVGAIVARRGWRAVGHPEVQALAGQLRSNVWSVVGACRRAVQTPSPWPSWSPRFGVARELNDLESGGPRHPWLRDLVGLPPVKRLQAAGYVQAMLMCAESRRVRAARQIHAPLQAPLMDLGLRLPADQLVFGGRDRALARLAFADRLPVAVTEREGKGDLTALYGRGLARALPLVRDRLLGGELRAMALLDVPALEARLEPEALMWHGGYGDILNLLAVETWVADWSSRTPVRSTETCC